MAGKIDPEELKMALHDSLFGTEDNGFCKACGQMAYGVEPDARNYECEGCGENQVFGAEEIALTEL